MKVVPKKQWRYPLSLERTYAKLLVAHVQRRFKVIHAFLPEMRDVILRYAVKLDADDDNTMVNAHIDILIDQLRRAMENHTAMLPVVRRTFDQVNRYNLQEWDAVMKSVFGVPIRSQSVAAMKQDADEEDVAKLKDIWVQQNLDLISSIDNETMQKIRDRMAERIIQNVDSSSLTKYLIQDIKDIAGVEVSRATLIGADQVGKLNGRLSQYRQQHAGLGEYQWNSCHDSRVRPAHAARSGHVYSWGNPPPDGNPGHPIRCRCVALPVIDLDKIAIKPRENSFVSVTGHGIMMPGEGKNLVSLEQARKKDHLFEITDMAIDRTPFVDVPDMSAAQNSSLLKTHKDLLLAARNENNGKEVLFVQHESFQGTPIKIYGTENSVSYASNVDTMVLKRRSYAGELVISHNHPSTKGFSFADIAVFIIDEFIGLSTVVTNQGQIYVLHKTGHFDYNKSRKLLDYLYDKYDLANYPEDEERQAAVAKAFLRQASKVGVWYEKSN